MDTALECKVDWCKKLLAGEKTVECRQYPLPEDLYKKPILLIATAGAEGVACLGDTTEAGSNAGSVFGWVSFSNCISYSSLESFSADQLRHCIEPGSSYGWSDGNQILYGWVVGKYEKFDQPLIPLPALERMHRSLHRVVK